MLVAWVLTCAFLGELQQASRCSAPQVPLQAYYKVHGASLLHACRAYASGEAHVGQEFAPVGAGASPDPAANPASPDLPAGPAWEASASAQEQPAEGSGAPNQAAPEPGLAPCSSAGGAAGGDAAAAVASVEGAGVAGGDAGETCTSEGFRLVMRQMLPRLEAALAAL